MVNRKNTEGYERGYLLSFDRSIELSISSGLFSL